MVVTKAEKIQYLSEKTDLAMINEDKDFYDVAEDIVYMVTNEQVRELANRPIGFECTVDYGEPFQFKWIWKDDGSNSRAVAIVRANDIKKFIKKDKAEYALLRDAHNFETTVDVFIYAPGGFLVSELYDLAKSAGETTRIAILTTPQGFNESVDERITQSKNIKTPT